VSFWSSSWFSLLQQLFFLYSVRFFPVTVFCDLMLYFYPKEDSLPEGRPNSFYLPFLRPLFFSNFSCPAGLPFSPFDFRSWIFVHLRKCFFCTNDVSPKKVSVLNTFFSLCESLRTPSLFDSLQSRDVIFASREPQFGLPRSNPHPPACRSCNS